MKRVTAFIVLMTATVCLIAGCGNSDKSKYENAMTLYEDGSYEKAAEAFEELGDYEDSAEMAQTARYDQAAEEYKEGNYDEAIAIYETIMDYKDSATQISACYYAQAGELYDAGDYDGAIAIYDTIGDYQDAKEKMVDANRQIMYENYGAVIDLLLDEIWFYNGGADTKVNGIAFTKDKATVKTIEFDGNGDQDRGSIEYDYFLDDQNIEVSNGDNNFTIPYKVNNGNITLGNGDYYTYDGIAEGLQGYWTLLESSFGLQSELNLLIDGDSYVMEKANEGFNLPKGQYYYTGPHVGFYKLGFGVIDFGSNLGDLFKWGFNIIDGEVTPLQYNHVCTRGEGLPGQGGYKFD